MNGNVQCPQTKGGNRCLYAERHLGDCRYGTIDPLRCEVRDASHMRQCRLLCYHHGAHEMINDTDRPLHELTNPCERCAAVEGWCPTHRCTSTLRGLRCEGPVRHSGGHGAVTHWDRDGGSTTLAHLRDKDAEAVDIEPGTAMRLSINGLSIPVVVTNVNVTTERDTMPGGWPGLQSQEISVEFRRSGP